MTWSTEELATIERAEELELVTVRADGTTRRPVTIWVVRVGDGIYVRSYRGARGAWYRHAVAGRLGRIRVADLDRPVAFETVTDRDASEAIDAAYRAKYARYSDSYIKPMVAEAARVTTLRLTPGDH